MLPATNLLLAQPPRWRTITTRTSTKRMRMAEMMPAMTYTMLSLWRKDLSGRRRDTSSIEG